MTYRFNLLIGIAILMAAGFAGAAQAQSPHQAVTIGFADGYKSPKVFAWGQTLVYKFKLTSHSAQTEKVSLKIEGFEMAGNKGGRATLYHLRYRLRPGQSLTIRYNVVPPTPPDIYRLRSFNLTATATAAGSRPASVSAISLHGQNNG
jgi:hypothetical protein